MPTFTPDQRTSLLLRRLVTVQSDETEMMAFLKDVAIAGGAALDVLLADAAEQWEAALVAGKADAEAQQAALALELTRLRRSLKQKVK